MLRPIAGQLPSVLVLSLFCCASAWPQPARARVTAEYTWVTPAVRALGVEQRTFDSEAVGCAVSYHVYLPHEYAAEPERRFPVLYWLHGGGGFSGNAIRTISGHFGDAMGAGHIPPMIVVFPHAPAGSLWANSSDGSMPVETIFIDELLPHIDETLRTIASREGRIVEGWSMGGYGAVRFGLKRPDLFCAASSLAGGPLEEEFPDVGDGTGRRAWVLDTILNGDLDYYRAQSPWQLAQENAETVREQVLLRLVIGEDDEMLEDTRGFSAHLTELGIPHGLTVVPGAGHEQMRVMSALRGEGWAFYREAIAGIIMAD